MNVCFLLITHVNGMATCSVACIQKQVRTSATQYSIISLQQTIYSLANQINFKAYIASCKETLEQEHSFNTKCSMKRDYNNTQYLS
jgi:spore coat protein U-like protein